MANLLSATRFRHDLREDRGAYAILFALLVVVLVGIAALVVDLAVARENRARDRSAVDSAVTGGAGYLNAGDAGGKPSEACRVAWDYLLDSVSGLPEYGKNTCDPENGGLPLTIPATCPTSAQTATFIDGGFEVVITWPVLNDSALMTNPDTAPAYPTQGIYEPVDGQPCARLAVEVFRTQSTYFAGVLGVDEQTTRSASVARSEIKYGAGDIYAALNILDPISCDALTTSGQGSIEVGSTNPERNAGVIAVESTATKPGNSQPQGQCGNAAAAAIKPLTNPLNFIRAVGPAGSTPYIYSAALNTALGGDPTHSYFMYPGVNPNITPTPSILTDQVGSSPVTDIFACSTTPCAPGGGDYIGDLRTSLGGTNAPDGFTTIPDPAYPDFTCQQNSSSPVIIFESGNWYVDCPGGLKVQTGLIFKGGQLVTASGIDVQGGCFAVNVPLASTSCSDISIIAASGSDPVTSNPAPTGDAVMYLQSGDLVKDAQSSVFLPQTFTFLGGGATSLGAGDGSLLWTSPLASACSSGDLACQYGNFFKLTLWSESNDTHEIGGQSYLGLRGVLFTPNAESVFTGQAVQSQTRAQFWTNTLEVKGQGTLVMDVDPEAAIPRPFSGGSLIR